MSDTANCIKVICAEIRDLLLEKNKKYGDSAFSPEQIFSKADPYEALNIRIDDKLRRIKTSPSNEDEDSELDLIGYLILRRAYRMKTTADANVLDYFDKLDEAEDVGATINNNSGSIYEHTEYKATITNMADNMIKDSYA